MKPSFLLRACAAALLLFTGAAWSAADPAWGVYASLQGRIWTSGDPDDALVSSYTWKVPGQVLVRTASHPKHLAVYEVEILTRAGDGRLDSATHRHDGVVTRTAVKVGADGSASRDLGDLVDILAPETDGVVPRSTCVGSSRTACRRSELRPVAAAVVEQLDAVREQWGYMADLAGRSFQMADSRVVRFSWIEPGRLMGEMISMEGRRYEYVMTRHQDGRLERVEQGDGSRWEGRKRPDGGMEWAGSGFMQANMNWVPGDDPGTLNQAWMSRLIPQKAVSYATFAAAVLKHKSGAALPPAEPSAQVHLDEKIVQARAQLLQQALQAAASTARPAPAVVAATTAAPVATTVVARTEPLRRETPAASSGRRRALVIGNNDYRNVPRLANARADAQAIAASLGRLGFAVTLRTDLDERGFKQALRAFRAEIQGGDEVVVYFAGHGVQLGGANFLLPVDIRGDGEDQVRDEALPLQRVLDDLAERRAGFMLAIVDACRDNPFKVAGRSIGGRGLAPTTAATGQMVIFSAGSGQQALDRLGPQDRNPNGLFTRVFLQEMEKAEQPVDRVLRNVRSEVVRLARTVGHDQTPALYDQAVGDFYLKR